MAYMICANMDQGSTDFQLEAAIGKVFASVSIEFFSSLHNFMGFRQSAKQLKSPSRQRKWIAIGFKGSRVRKCKINH